MSIKTAFCRRTCLSFIATSLVVCSGALFSGCALAPPGKPAKPGLQSAMTKPLKPHQTKKVIREASSNFVLGQGLGDAAMNVGAAVVFPPYALYLLGNAAVEVGIRGALCKRRPSRGCAASLG